MAIAIHFELLATSERRWQIGHCGLVAEAADSVDSPEIIAANRIAGQTKSDSAALSASGILARLFHVDSRHKLRHDGVPALSHPTLNSNRSTSP